jgi:hypothetical protein
VRQFDCSCGWRFIVGRRHVYGPLYPLGLPGDYGGWVKGRMMTRDEWEETESDCAYRFKRKSRLTLVP